MWGVGEPVDVGWAGDPGSRAARWATVSGLHARPAEIHHTGHQRGVQVALTVAGARALVGVPAAALAREILDVEQVAPDLQHLPEQLDTTAWSDAESVVARALTGALARRGAAAPRAEVGRALARLSRGDSVQQVADDVGFSRRRLSSLVGAECGLTPKEFQRVARFERSRRVLGHRPLAEVASSCGYADQAHLTREWSAMAGCAPTTWLMEEFPFLQDARPDDPRD